MRLIRKTNATDVLFLHIDDRATIRYQYLNKELRESLLFHLLYSDRLLVPTNFLLSNMNIGDLFQYGGEVSEKSDIYKLMSSGAIVPTLFRRDYGSIGDYARYALQEERILLPCPTDQWLRRADLLDEFGYAAPREGFRSAYKETVVRLLQDETLQHHYFVRCLAQGREYVRRMVDQLRSEGGATRSDVYRLTQQAPSEKVRLAAEQIADAAYYGTFADIFKAKVAVSSIYYPALLVHYYQTEPERRPLVFTPAIEEDIIEASIPDSGPLSLAEVFNNLKDSSLRKNWLSTLRKKMREGRVDLTDSEVLASLVPWTRFVLHYLSLPSSLQRKDALGIQRRVRLQTRGLQFGRDAMLLASVAFAASDVVHGRPPITSMAFAFASTTAEILLRKVEADFKKRLPSFGSVIPLFTRLFTLRGKRPGA